MRILFVNVPYSGHTLPTLGTVTMLVNNGHNVGYINSPVWKKRIEATGAEFIPYLDYNEHPSLAYDITHALKAAYKRAEQVIDQYDAVVYEAFAQVGKLVADKAGKPCVRLFTSFAWNERSFEVLTKEAPYWRPLRSAFLRFCASKIAASGIKFHRGNLINDIRFDIPDLNLTYTSREFQVCGDSFDERFKFCGPSIYQRADMPFDMPDNDKPIVYISLGTVSVIRFFFKKCIKAFSGTDLNVIIAVGNGIKTERFKNLPENIRVCNFAPQLKILERASVFITHGGANSVYEAIYYRVPMLVFPQATEQHATANHVERLKLGYRIHGYSITPDEIRDKTMALINNSAIHDSMEKMYEYDRIAMEKFNSAAIIEDYLKRRINH